MAIRSENEGADALGPFFSFFYDAVVGGVRDYYQFYANHAAKHRVTTRRSLIRDHIVFRLQSGLAEEPGVEIVSRYGTTFFGLVSQFLMKAHMLNKNMCIVLNKTQHSFNFNENVVEPSIPGDGFQKTTALYLGYIPNTDNPLSPRVFLVCPAGNEPAWCIELMRSEGAEIVQIVRPAGDLDPEALVEIPEAPERKQDDE